MLRAFAGGTVFGERLGAATPTVLALHGWRRTHADFVAVFPDSGRLGAIGLDLPGFGATPPPTKAWGSACYARAIVPVLEEMGGPAVVLGHSFGGRVALQLALQAPGLVRGLVLTGVPLLRPSGPRPRPALSYRVVRALAARRLVSAGRLEAARRRHGSADYRAAEGVMRDVLVRLAQEDYAPLLARLEVPVALVWGAGDTVVPPEVAERVVQLVPGARLELLPGVGHLTPTEAPGALAAACSGYLS